MLGYPIKFIHIVLANKKKIVILSKKKINETICLNLVGESKWTAPKELNLKFTHFVFYIWQNLVKAAILRSTTVV